MNKVRIHRRGKQSLFSLFFSLLLFIQGPFSHAAMPDSHIELTQTGPGVCGTWAPWKDYSALVLVSESVTIVLRDNHAEVRGEYSLYNPNREPVTETIGFPTITVGKPKLLIQNLETTINDRRVKLRARDRDRVGNFDYAEYFPFAQLFDLKERWYVASIAMPPRGKTTIKCKYVVPYLYKHEKLNGRQEYSNKLFRYIRANAHRWRKRRIDQSTIYVRTKVSNKKALTITPTPIRGGAGIFTYNFNRQNPSKENEIRAVYDSLSFGVTPFGFRSPSRPPPLVATKTGNYDYANLFDGDPTTAWCEGDMGSGVGLGFEIEWGRYKRINSIQITPAFAEPEKDFWNRNRLKTIKAYIAKPGYRSPAQKIHLEDSPETQKFPIGNKDKATMLVLELNKITPGQYLNDTCIGDIKINFHPDSFDPTFRPTKK